MVSDKNVRKESNVNVYHNDETIFVHNMVHNHVDYYVRIQEKFPGTNKTKQQRLSQYFFKELIVILTNRIVQNPLNFLVFLYHLFVHLDTVLVR